MIKLNVRELAERMGIENAAQLQRKTGIAKNAAARLWSGEAETVSLKTLDDLCVGLNCKLADLITRIEEQEQLRRANARWENEGGAM